MFFIDWFKKIFINLLNWALFLMISINFYENGFFFIFALNFRIFLEIQISKTKKFVNKCEFDFNIFHHFIVVVDYFKNIIFCSNKFCRRIVFFRLKFFFQFLEKFFLSIFKLFFFFLIQNFYSKKSIFFFRIVNMIRSNFESISRNR